MEQIDAFVRLSEIRVHKHPVARLLTQINALADRFSILMFTHAVEKKHGNATQRWT